MKHRNELSQYTLRQLEILSKYYEIDYEKKLVRLCFVADSIDEFLDTSLSTTERPLLSDLLLTKISNLSHSVPKAFSISVSLKIKDYKGYNPNLILYAIEDSFEIFAYDRKVETNKLTLRTSGLIFFGISLFAWLFFLCTFKFLGDQDGQSHRLIHELIFAIGSALIWQCVYFIFIPNSSYNSILFSILDRVAEISLLDENGKLLAYADNAKMKENWAIEKRGYVFARKLLVAVGTGLLCLASYDLTEIVTISIALSKSGDPLYIYALIIDIGCVIFMALTGIGAISFYLDSGPFKKLVPVFGALSSLLCICNTINYCIELSRNPSYTAMGLIVNAILVALSITLFVSSIILTRNMRKNRKTQNLNK